MQEVYAALATAELITKDEPSHLQYNYNGNTSSDIKASMKIDWEPNGEAFSGTDNQIFKSMEILAGCGSMKIE